MRPPVEIKEALTRMRSDYPDPSKVCFIMMKFGKTKTHDRIVSCIKKTLAMYGITGIRSDDKQYHDDVFYNIQVYLYGCAFGVAVFERLEADQFNPNVSLEVGHMIAQRKPVCLLKDQTLETLQADLLGKIYRKFDPQDPEGTIQPELSRWLRDMGLVVAEVLDGSTRNLPKQAENRLMHLVSNYLRSLGFTGREGDQFDFPERPEVRFDIDENGIARILSVDVLVSVAFRRKGISKMDIFSHYTTDPEADQPPFVTLGDIVLEGDRSRKDLDIHGLDDKLEKGLSRLLRRFVSEFSVHVTLGQVKT
jgi:hypothetical protein